jgi:alpha-galactosidase
MMKKTVCILVLFAGLLPEAVYAQSNTSLRAKTTPDPVKWMNRHFAEGKQPPFSFVYGGKRSATFIAGWRYQSQKQTVAPDKEIYLHTYTEPGGGLAVKCEVTVFKDFPAVEWVLKFENTSSRNSPLLEQAKVIDHAFGTASGDFILHHSRGSDAARNDFEPLDRPLKVGDEVHLSPDRGRSSDGSAFPFFNIEAPGEIGIVVAAGWTGKWYADIARPSERTVTLASGMERMQLSLYPQEEIRTPRICLLFWSGDDRMTGHNQFRRFVLRHHSRQINGQFAEYPLATNFDHQNPAPCTEFECLTADWAVASIRQKQYLDVLPEVFWLDAGWYAGCGKEQETGRWWQNVGNWTPDKERFPDGLRPVADAAHQAGAKFLVWFEPERVRPGTQFDREHPEWLIKLPDDDNYLFDLGNPDARIWLTDYISDFLRREGIDHYRQDFNFDPYPYWQAKDLPDRIGMAEIRHIEGLYAYWDSLLVRFPELLIDNCASGGRRLDLETVSRSAPLWRTDYQYGEPNGYQCHTYGLNFYLPVHGTGPSSADNYNFRSGLLGAMTTGLCCRPIEDIRNTIRDYKELRPYFYGDYYPLTSSVNYTGDGVWLAFQMDRPERGDGIVLAFRRKDSAQEYIQVRLSGVDSQQTYELYDEDSQTRERKTGSELKSGITLRIPATPGSLLIRYKQIK